MAKNKKSKILAMALCASVMTGIYASPVMAEEQINSANNYSSVIANKNGTIDFQVWTTLGDGRQTLARIASFDADGFSIHNASGRFPVFYIGRHNGDFMAAGGDFAVDGDGNVTANGTLRVAGGDFTVDGDGNVVSLGNVTSTDGIRSYDLNTIGANTAGIRREGDENSGGHRTIIEEQLVVNKESGVISNKNASFTVDSSGNLVASTLGNNSGTFGVNGEGAVKAANGAFTVDKDGSVTTKGTLSVADGDFKVDENGAVTAAVGSNIAGVQFNRGAIDFNNAQLRNIARVTSQEYISGHSKFEDGQLTLGREENQVLTAAKLGVINDVIQEDGSVVSKGDVKSNLNGKEYSLNQVGHNTEGITNTSNSKNAETTIQGTLKVKDNGSFQNADGSFRVNANGEIQAAGGKFYVDKYGNVKNVGTVDGVDVSELASNFNTTNANVGGIARVDSDGDSKLDTTVIENTLTVSENGIGMAKGDMQLTATEAGFAAVKGDNAINLNESGVNLSAGNDNFVSVTQDGIGLQGGTSQVIMNSNNGAVFRNGDKAVNGETVINGGMLTASNDIATTNADGSTKYTLNTVGTDLDALETTVGEDGRLGGIDRVDTNNDGTLDTTIIEKTLAVSETGIAMSKGDMQLAVNEAGFAAVKGDNQINLNENGINLTAGNNVISMTDAGIGFAGTVYTGNASDLHFTYDGFTGVGGTTVAAGNYTLDDLVDTVADIYDRTQGITYENGTTTVDGNLNVKGDATTGEGGNLDAGSGTIGDVTMSDGNINTDGVINAGGGGTIGGATVDKDGNINTDGVINAGGGTIGDVTMSDGNINTDGVINAGGGTIGNVTMSDGNINTDGVINAGGGTIGDVTMSGGKVTAGQTTVSNDGVSIADKTIISDHDVVINSGTENEVSLSDVGNRVSNVEQGVSELNNRVGELEDRIDKVGAMAAAIANLRTMGYDPAAPTEVAVGIGQYRDETGAALGLFHYPNRDFMLSLSVSTSGDEVMGGIGATWKFGRKSPEKVAEIKKAQAEADVRRAEEAKLAKAEEMKQAAKEAKIKAQQERHAKLAAERAAQAEAAK